MKNKNTLIVIGITIAFIVVLIFLIPEISRRIALSECNRQEVEKSDKAVKETIARVGVGPSYETIIDTVNTRVALCMKRKGF